MSIRSTTLNNYATTAINREVDSRYDVIKEVSKYLDEIQYINDEGITTLVQVLEDAKDFSGIDVETVYVETEAEAEAAVAWDANTQTLTVPSLKGDKGDQGIQGEQGLQGPQGQRGLPGEAGAKGDKGDQGSVGPQGQQGVQGPAGVDGADGADLTITSIDNIGNGRYTWNFSDGTEYTTDDLRGATGLQGSQGNDGLDGDAFSRLAKHATTDTYGRYGEAGQTDTYAVMVMDTATSTEFVSGYVDIKNGNPGNMDAAIYDTDFDGVVDNSERVGGKTLAEIESDRNTAIQEAALNLGTNYMAADNAAKALLTGLTEGDKVFVTDDGDGKWAHYITTTVTDGQGSTSTFEVIMDEDTYLNANTASGIKSAYESNADTNADRKSVV